MANDDPNATKRCMSLDEYQRFHWHLREGDRCPHEVCLRVLSVPGLPDNLHDELYDNMYTLIDTYYYTPRDGWDRIWFGLQRILVDTLPQPANDSPNWVLQIQKIVCDP